MKMMTKVFGTWAKFLSISRDSSDVGDGILKTIILICSVTKSLNSMFEELIESFNGSICLWVVHWNLDVMYAVRLQEGHEFTRM